MAKNIKKIARSLGAKVVSKVPDTGGGAFGAARLASLLQRRLLPQRGERPGRPSDASWTHRSKVPMSDETLERLRRLAARMSDTKRKVSPMQVAAQILEENVEKYANEISAK